MLDVLGPAIKFVLSPEKNSLSIYRCLYVIMYADTLATIRQYPLSGAHSSNEKILVHSGMQNPQDLAVDYTNQRLYWIDNLSNASCAIGVYDLKSGTQSQFGTVIDNCQSRSIDFSVVSPQLSSCHPFLGALVFISFGWVQT